MSKITGTDHGEAFALRVVSGMVIDGSLIVTWATGDFASSQIDWGFDSSVPNRTPIIMLQPGDRGFNPANPMPKLVRYHRIQFPITYVDTEHFFRIISTNKAERTEISRVYSVYITAKVWHESEVASVHINVRPVEVSDITVTDNSSFESRPSANPTALSMFGSVLHKITGQELAVNSSNSNDQKTSFETNINISVD